MNEATMTPQEEPADWQPQTASDRPEGVLAYRCPAHAEFFPDEDPVLPYTEFNVDPFTLLRKHERSCRQCTAARRTGLQNLPPLERVHVVWNKVVRERDQLERQGKKYSEEWESTEWHLKFLNNQLMQLQCEQEEVASDGDR